MKVMAPVRILLILILTVGAHFNSPARAQVQRLVELSERDYVDAMQGMGNNLLNRFDNMPPIKFVLKEDSRFYDEHGKLHALAFYDSGNKLIYVNPGYTNRATYPQMVDTVMHELTHAWVDWRGLSSNEAGGHNEAFIRKALQLGVNLNSTLAAFPDARTTYERLRASNVGGSGGGATIEGGDIRPSGGKRDPSRDKDFFGENIYEFWFVSFTYDTSGKGTPGSKENKLYKVAKKLEINQRYVWEGQSWKVYAITGSRVWLSNLDPSRDEGAFGENVYEFWYVSFIYDSGGQGTVKSRENKRHTVTTKPQINQRYVWKGQSWKVYAVNGSRVWLANLDPSRDEGAFGDNVYEFWYVSDTYRENKLHAVTQKPRINQRYVWGGQSWKVYAITGSRIWLTKAR